MVASESLKSYRKVIAGSERNFGIVFAIIFAIVAFLPLYHERDIRWWAVPMSAAFLICAFLVPRVAPPTQQTMVHAWTRVASHC